MPPCHLVKPLVAHDRPKVEGFNPSGMSACAVRRGASAQFDDSGHLAPLLHVHAQYGRLRITRRDGAPQRGTVALFSAGIDTVELGLRAPQSSAGDAGTDARERASPTAPRPSSVPPLVPAAVDRRGQLLPARRCRWRLVCLDPRQRDRAGSATGRGRTADPDIIVRAPNRWHTGRQWNRGSVQRS